MLESSPASATFTEPLRGVGAARGDLGHGSALPGFLGPHGYVLVTDKEARTERWPCLG